MLHKGARRVGCHTKPYQTILTVTIQNIIFHARGHAGRVVHGGVSGTLLMLKEAPLETSNSEILPNHRMGSIPNYTRLVSPAGNITAPSYRQSFVSFQAWKVDCMEIIRSSNKMFEEIKIALTLIIQKEAP